MLLAPDSRSLEAALLVLDQVARSGHSGVVVTPPAAATQGICPVPSSSSAVEGPPCAPVPAHHAAHAGVVEGLQLGSLGAREPMTLLPRT